MVWSPLQSFLQTTGMPVPIQNRTFFCFLRQGTYGLSPTSRWVIQLDGEQTVQLSVPEVQKPYPHLEYTPNGPFNGSALPETTLKEGDVLYIPRGFIVQSGTHTEKPSMHLVVHVESHRQTFRDALITVITCCLCPKAKDIILTPLGESNTHTWYHVIVAAVKVRHL